jgi:protein-tyrosine-phosphatase
MQPFDNSPVLFACNLNTVRSPMAAALLRSLRPSLEAQSVGLQAGEADPLMVAVMAELGLDLAGHRPHLFTDLRPGLFSLIVTLSPEAQTSALEWTRSAHTPVEYWPTFDATLVEGSREQRLAAYRAVRDELLKKLKTRFESEHV